MRKLEEAHTQLETIKAVLDKTGQIFAQWRQVGLTGQAYKQKSVPIGVLRIDIQATKKGLPGLLRTRQSLS